MKAISFYNNNINPELVEYQKKVFNHLGIDIEQVCHDLGHGEAIDEWIRNNEWESVAIFDIDCIPLNKIAYHHAIAQASESVFGAAQKANHIKDSSVYASPAFICFSKQVFDKLGWPTFKEGFGFDVGGFVSHVARQVGVNVSLLWPTDVEDEKWELTEDIKFGHGTTYQGMIYHAFESRFNHESTSRFISKCKEVIGE